MSETTIPQIPVLKKGTAVTITLDFGLIERMQATLAFIVQDKTQQELEAIKEHITQATLTGWEASAIALTQLIQSIVKQADRDGNIEYKNLSDIMGELKS